MIDLERLAQLIERNRNNGVDFGTFENAPGEEWIEMAESRLDCKLPSSYKWFLNNYGGGEICGKEIYSIYGLDFETANGGDIVFQYLAHQHAGTLNKDEIPLAINDFGEIFFMKRVLGSEDEYLVWVKRGKESFKYAEKFAEFLIMQIDELCSA